MRLNFQFDTISFFIGMAVATIIWWAIMLSRPLIDQLLATYREKQKERALQASSGLEETHRKIVYKQTQGLHLAASLFALRPPAESTAPLSGRPLSMCTTCTRSPPLCARAGVADKGRVVSSRATTSRIRRDMAGELLKGIDRHPAE